MIPPPTAGAIRQPVRLTPLHPSSDHAWAWGVSKHGQSRAGFFEFYCPIFQSQGIYGCGSIGHMFFLIHIRIRIRGDRAAFLYRDRLRQSSRINMGKVEGGGDGLSQLTWPTRRTATCQMFVGSEMQDLVMDWHHASKAGK